MGNIFWGIFSKSSEFFWRNVLGKFFGEDFFGRIFWEEFFVYIGIDLFVKILVFVKILSKSKKVGRKEEFRSLEVRVQAYRT